VPDATKSGGFRQKLVAHDLLEILLGEVNRQLEQMHIIMTEGRAISSTPHQLRRPGLAPAKAQMAGPALILMQAGTSSLQQRQAQTHLWLLCSYRGQRRWFHPSPDRTTGNAMITASAIRYCWAARPAYYPIKLLYGA